MISVIVHLLNHRDIAEGAYDPVFRDVANNQAEWSASNIRECINGLACPNGHEPHGTVSISANYERGPLIRKDAFCCEEMKALIP